MVVDFNVKGSLIAGRDGRLFLFSASVSSGSTVLAASGGLPAELLSRKVAEVIFEHIVRKLLSLSQDLCVAVVEQVCRHFMIELSEERKKDLQQLLSRCQKLLDVPQLARLLVVKLDTQSIQNFVSTAYSSKLVIKKGPVEFAVNVAKAQEAMAEQARLFLEVLDQMNAANNLLGDGEGFVAVRSLEEFANGKKVTVLYRSTNPEAAVQRALACVGPQRYDMVSCNCETYVNYWATGFPRSMQSTAAVAAVGGASSGVAGFAGACASGVAYVSVSSGGLLGWLGLATTTVFSPALALGGAAVAFVGGGASFALAKKLRERHSFKPVVKDSLEESSPEAIVTRFIARKASSGGATISQVQEESQRAFDSFECPLLDLEDTP